MREYGHIARGGRWLLGGTVAALLLSSVLVSSAAIINLQTWNEYGWTDQNGGANYLADGSIIYIMGSGDTVNDGMEMVGTNYIASSTQGDDVFLGQVTIDSNGEFYGADIFFNDNVVSNVYYRLFDSTGPRIVGMVHWMTTTVWDLPDPEFGVVEFEAPDHWSTTNYDHFIVIPEPGVATIFFVMMAVMVGTSKSFHTGKKAGGFKRMGRHRKKM